MPLRPIRPTDLHYLYELLRSTPEFTDAEVATAMEMLEESLKRPESGYWSVIASEADPVGFAIWGPTPMTDFTYDLYWIVSHPATRMSGVGKALLAEVERLVGERGGRIIRVETSTTEPYLPTRQFYEQAGYEASGRIRDFYRTGDDLLILVKRLEASLSGVG